MATPHATIAIISIGQMGLGIASLLKSHNYAITTNISGRSSATKDRAESIGIQLLDTDEELVASADYVLSIVPPRDAIATAERVIAALEKQQQQQQQQQKSTEKPASSEQAKRMLYYLDLNAISPDTVRKIGGMFEERVKEEVRFVDGGIIGSPPIAPSASPDSSKEAKGSDSPGSDWTRPGVPLSGPHELPSAHLASVLNVQHVANTIGTASGLKCCFAALTKGFTALSLQSFTTASSLGVLPQLKDYMDQYNPHARLKAERGIVGCTHKAYRWVEEMRQIGECFAGDGGWQQASVFREIAGLFQELADVVEKKGREGMEHVDGVVGILGNDLQSTKQ
ncbi:6-phosphogluconate dehydrogenase [Bipolaris maydis]|nr:6-phosphogluconate dehydrogenase [Bipolaris maydis]